MSSQTNRHVVFLFFVFVFYIFILKIIPSSRPDRFWAFLLASVITRRSECDRILKCVAWRGGGRGGGISVRTFLGFFFSKIKGSQEIVEHMMDWEKRKR